MSTTTTRTNTTTTTKSIEEWQNIALSKVFHLSLDPSDPRSIISITNELVLDLNDTQIYRHPSSNQPLFTHSILERVLIAYFAIYSNVQPTTSLTHYLLDCYCRASDIHDNLQDKYKATDLPDRLAILNSSKDMIFNYIGILIMFPDMFPQNPSFIGTSASEIIKRFIDNSFPVHFLSSFIDRYCNDDSKDQVLFPLLVSFSAEMRNRKIDTNSSNMFLKLNELLSLQPVPHLICSLPSFSMDKVPPKVFELTTFLGPFLRISGFVLDDPNICTTFFANASDRDQTDLVTSMRSLSLSIQHTQNSMYTLFNQLVRSSPELRDATMTYLGQALKLNEKRNGMQLNPEHVGSFGFTQNVGVVLLRACDPFMIPPFQKLHLIDPMYLCHPKAKYDVSDLTKMNASDQDAKLFYTNQQHSSTNKTPNFISGCFFLTLGWLHTGYIRTLSFYKQFSKDLKDRQDQLNNAQRDLVEVHQGQPSSAMAESMVKMLKQQVNTMLGCRLSMDAQIQDHQLLEQVTRFYNLVAAWLLCTLVQSNNITYPYREPLDLPLRTESLVFKHFPEHFVEDMIDFLIFVLRFDRLLLQANQVDLFIELFVVILMSPDFIKNPYLKSKMAEVFFSMTFHHELMIPLSNHPTSVKYLVQSLLRLYVDVEITGASSQFYDKFNIRYNIQLIFKSIWTYAVHRSRVKELSRDDVFVRFINMTMNDLRYLLDEGLSKLTEIFTIQTEMASPEWTTKPKSEQDERLATLQTAERHATSYMMLAGQTLESFSFFSKDIPEPFLTPEIIDRLAAMLDYNLSNLVGPKCMELKVKDPEKYAFKPRTLLCTLIDVYLNLAPFPDFVKAVARDGRSWRSEWMQKAAGVMAKTGLKPGSDIELLEQFTHRVEQAIVAELADEQEMGDIPEEFLDPIMFTLMDDPVILPSSSVTVDRSTITAHLLGENRDPFNRAELKIEDVVPNTDLKHKIIAWRSSKRKQGTNS